MKLIGLYSSNLKKLLITLLFAIYFSIIFIILNRSYYFFINIIFILYYVVNIYISKKFNLKDFYISIFSFLFIIAILLALYLLFIIFEFVFILSWISYLMNISLYIFIVYYIYFEIFIRLYDKEAISKLLYFLFSILLLFIEFSTQSIILSGLFIFISYSFIEFYNKKSLKDFLVKVSSILVILIFTFIIVIQFIQQNETRKSNPVLEKKVDNSFSFQNKLNMNASNSFDNKVIFFVKIKPEDLDAYLLKGINYSSYNSKDGFYINWNKKDMDFPFSVNNKEWIANLDEDSNREYTIFNLSLEKGKVLGEQKIIKAYPMDSKEKHNFKNILKIESKVNLDKIDNFSYKTLSKKELDFYTDIGKDDNEIKSFVDEKINNLPEYKKNELGYIRYFYEMFLNDFTYSLKVPNKKGIDGIKKFLFDNKSGYCSYFAYSYAYIMRMLGIPSRVVGGFSVTQENKIVDFFKVMDFNAHAWVEIYDDKYGWITIDPTSANVSVQDQMNSNFNYDMKQNEEEYLESLLRIMNSLYKKDNLEKQQLENDDFSNDNEIKENNWWFFIFLICFLLLILYTFRFILLFYLSKNVLKPKFVINYYYKSILKFTRKFKCITLEEINKEYTKIPLDDFIKNYYEINFYKKKRLKISKTSFLQFHHFYHHLFYSFLRSLFR